MIKVKCYTNIDDYRFCKWPTELQVLPRVGEYVSADMDRRLKVISITHYTNVIVLELHK